MFNKNIYFKYELEDENKMFNEVIPRMADTEELIGFILKYFNSDFKIGKCRGLPSYCGLTTKGIIGMLKDQDVIPSNLMSKSKVNYDVNTYSIMNALLTMYWDEYAHSLLDMKLNKFSCGIVLRYIEQNAELMNKLFTKSEYCAMYDLFKDECRPDLFLPILNTYNGVPVDNATNAGKAVLSQRKKVDNSFCINQDNFVVHDSIVDFHTFDTIMNEIRCFESTYHRCSAVIQDCGKEVFALS